MKARIETSKHRLIKMKQYKLPPTSPFHVITSTNKPFQL